MNFQDHSPPHVLTWRRREPRENVGPPDAKPALSFPVVLRKKA